MIWVINHSNIIIPRVTKTKYKTVLKSFEKWHEEQFGNEPYYQDSGLFHIFLKNESFAEKNHSSI